MVLIYSFINNDNKAELLFIGVLAHFFIDTNIEITFKRLMDVFTRQTSQKSDTRFFPGTPLSHRLWWRLKLFHFGRLFYLLRWCHSGKLWGHLSHPNVPLQNRYWGRTHTRCALRGNNLLTITRGSHHWLHFLGTRCYFLSEVSWLLQIICPNLHNHHLWSRW